MEVTLYSALVLKAPLMMPRKQATICKAVIQKIYFSLSLSLLSPYASSPSFFFLFFTFVVSYIICKE